MTEESTAKSETESVGARISVIIPIYQAENTLDKCLRSVLAQTHADLEVLCVTDAARDASADIVRRYAETDSRVVLIDREGDGPATARNAGLDAATGSYIGFVDADDFIEPEMYERLLALLCGASAELANCGHASFSADGTSKRAALKTDGIVDVYDTDDLGRLISTTPDFVWDKLFVARIIRDSDVRFPDGRFYGEDTVFLTQYLSHVKRAIFADEPYYNYNAFSQGSITNTISDRWYDIFENLKDILYYFRERLSDADFGTLSPYLAELCIRYYDRRANAMIRHAEKDFQVRYLNDSFDFLTRNFPDWKARMRALPDVAFPKIKTNLVLMRLYIAAPAFLKQRLARRLTK